MTKSSSVNASIPVLFDSSGRCSIHPHVKLRQRALTSIALGGWQIIRPICPECVVESSSYYPSSVREEESITRDNCVDASSACVWDGDSRNGVDPAAPSHDKAVPIRLESRDDCNEGPPEKAITRRPRNSRRRSPLILIATEQEKKELEANGRKLHAKLSRLSRGKEREGCASTRRSPISGMSSVPVSIMSFRIKKESNSNEEALRPIFNVSNINGVKMSTTKEPSSPFTHSNLVISNQQHENLSPTSVANNFADFPSKQTSDVPERSLVNIEFSGLQPPPFGPHNYENEPQSAFSKSISNGSYRLGEVAKYEDIVEFATKKESVTAIRCLPLGSPLFVKRSNGDWTYAVVREKDESISVVLDRKHSTKVLATRKWHSCLRLVRSFSESSSKEDPVSKQRQQQQPLMQETSLCNNVIAPSRDNFNSALLILPPPSHDGDALGRSFHRIISANSFHGGKSHPALTPHASPNLEAKHFYGSHRKRFASRSFRSRVTHHTQTYPILESGGESELSSQNNSELCSKNLRLRGMEP